MVLLYIAGYITRNDSALPEEKLLNKTTFYHQTFVQYLDVMDRDDLIYQELTLANGQSFVLYFLILLKREFAENFFVICVCVCVCACVCVCV